MIIVLPYQTYVDHHELIRDYVESVEKDFIVVAIQSTMSTKYARVFSKGNVKRVSSTMVVEHPTFIIEARNAKQKQQLTMEVQVGEDGRLLVTEREIV